MFDFIRDWLPELHGNWGGQIDDLFILSTVLTTLAFIAVCALLVWCMVAYRERPGHKASYFHGNSRIHLLTTGLLSALVFVGLDYQLESRGRRVVEAYKDGFAAAERDMRVQVRGQQFKWYFRYHGPDGKFGTPDDFVMDDLVLPVGHKIAVQIQSKDVIHSFFLPYHRLKQDAVPGLVTTTWFETTHLSWHNATPEQRAEAGGVPETWEVACAELCGAQHTTMRNRMLVMEQAEYDRWHAEQVAKDAKYDFALGEEENEQGDIVNWGWTWEPRGWMSRSPDFEKKPEDEAPAHEEGH